MFFLFACVTKQNIVQILLVGCPETWIIMIKAKQSTAIGLSGTSWQQWGIFWVVSNCILSLAERRASATQFFKPLAILQNTVGASTVQMLQGGYTLE